MLLYRCYSTDRSCSVVQSDRPLATTRASALLTRQPRHGQQDQRGRGVRILSLVVPRRCCGGARAGGRREGDEATAPSVLVAGGHQDVAGSHVVSNHQAAIYRELRRAAEEHLLLIE